MGILLAFAPFIVFAIVDRLFDPTVGLVAGAVTSAALLIRDWLSPVRQPKLLEIGTAALFTSLAALAIWGGMHWSILGVRLRVDAGLLLIVLGTMALRRPFTLQYARESVAKGYWDSPEFFRTNYVITAVWASAFAVMVIADLILLYRPDLPPRFGVVATILVIVGAVKFTGWYPSRDRKSSDTD